eukprot:376083_1
MYHKKTCRNFLSKMWYFLFFLAAYCVISILRNKLYVASNSQSKIDQHLYNSLNKDPSDINQRYNAFNTCIMKQNSMCSPVSCNGNESITSYQGWIHRCNNFKRNRPNFIGRERAACLISSKYKFAYIHTLKSGGSSMKTNMKKCLCNVTCSKYEYELRDCDDELFGDDKYFIFTFVRNPYSRMVSNYFFRKAHKTTEWIKLETEEGGDDNLMPISFEQFVKNTTLMDKYSYTHKAHLLPQIQFIFDKNNCPSVDYIGKLENMNIDFNFIMEHIWEKYNDFPMKKCIDEANRKVNAFGTKSLTQSGQKSWNDMYRDDTQIIESVIKMYSDDFALLNYETDIY